MTTSATATPRSAWISDRTRRLDQHTAQRRGTPAPPWGPVGSPARGAQRWDRAAATTDDDQSIAVSRGHPNAPACSAAQAAKVRAGRPVTCSTVGSTVYASGGGLRP